MSNIVTLSNVIIGGMLGVASSGVLSEFNPYLSALAGLIGGIVFPIIFKSPTYISVMDGQSVVNRQNWAVTLIQYEGTCRQHVQIIIEGVTWSGYFLKRAHLKGYSPESCSSPSCVEVIDNPPQTIEFDRRSEVWIVSCKKGNEMMFEIEKEKNQPKKLNILGRYSWFSRDGADSCITWAIEKLKIAGINLPLGYLNKMVTITSTYTYSKNYFSNLSLSKGNS